MATLPTALITLAELKTYLGITVDDFDPKLEQLVDGVTVAFEDFTQSAFVNRTVTNRSRANGAKPKRRGGARFLFLTPAPIVSVTSIADDEGNTIDPADFHIESEEGMLEYDGHWPWPDQRWIVTYVAGRAADVTLVSRHVKLLAYRTCSAWYARSDSTIKSQRIGDLSITYNVESASGQSNTLPEGVLPDAIKRDLGPYSILEV